MLVPGGGVVGRAIDKSWLTLVAAGYSLYITLLKYRFLQNYLEQVSEWINTN
ncbi:hypothetical protein J6590_028357 [Homalodisca vitripennis]|nr:hypothetical protein J6590_028357 [Homalodisca vitripennis]